MRQSLRPYTRLRGLAAGVLIVILLGTGCGRQVAPAVEPVTISFAAPNYARDSYARLIEEFEAAFPHITVNLMSQGGPGASMEASCTTCDVVRVALADLTSERLTEFRPLDDLIQAGTSASDTVFPLSDLVEGTAEAIRLEGRQLGIPAGINPVVVYYNTERFAAAGIKIPENRWTLDEFALTAQTAQSPAGAVDYTYGYCARPELGDAAIFTYLLGGQLVDNLVEPTRPTLDSPANEDALAWYTGLRRSYQANPPPEDVQAQMGDITRAIWMGRCGLWLGFYADRARFAGFLSDRGRAVPGMVPLPAGKESFGVAALDVYAILRNSQKATAAWQWIKFLIDQPEAATPLLAPRTSQLTAQTYAALVDKETLRIARNLPDRLFIWDSSLETSAIGSAVAAYLQAVEQVANGDLDAEAALGEAQVQAEALFVR